MKWETVASTIGHNAFTLWKNGRQLITLVFNPASNAARVEYADEKRVYLLRKEGFLKNKTVVRTEYGMLIGHMGSEKNEDFIVVNNERFFYTIEDEQKPSVTIYKDSKENPLAICALDVPAASLPKRNKRFLLDKMHYSLLMALCLYLFQGTTANNLSAEIAL